MAQLVDVRCPLPSLDKQRDGQTCNKLVVQVEPGSSGRGYCPRHNQHFEFHVDDQSAFGGDWAQPTPTSDEPK